MVHLVPSPLSEAARQVVRRLQAAGFAALWAGGCVRDMIMGRPPKDYDIATGATPDQVLELFPRAVAVGKAFGVVRVALGDHEFEVATFRKDHAYRDGRRPEAVSFTDEKTDALRRDFTINALFFDPVAGTVHDYAGGQADIAARLIRAVGRAEDRFAEDHLRMLRAIRFAATLDFTVDPATFEAIRQHAPAIGKISGERIQQELTRTLLESARPGDAVGMMLSAGLLAVILPEVAALRGQAQPPQFHPEGDVFTHTLLMLNAMLAGPAGSQPSLRLAYAVLFHDIGKPPTAQLTDGRIRFNQHAQHGAAMAEAILKRLRLPSDDIKAIVFSIANHMRFMDVRKMRRATLHRLVGAATFPLELELHRLDCAASHGDMQNFDFLREFEREYRARPVLPKPWVTGDDLLALGVPNGREVGRWKKLAYDAQLENAVASREAALAWVKKLVDAKRAESG